MKQFKTKKELIYNNYQLGIYLKISNINNFGNKLSTHQFIIKNNSIHNLILFFIRLAIYIEIYSQKQNSNQ